MLKCRIPSLQFSGYHCSLVCLTFNKLHETHENKPKNKEVCLNMLRRILTNLLNYMICSQENYQSVIQSKGYFTVYPVLMMV